MTGIQELFDDIADLRQKSRHIHNAKRRNFEKLVDRVELFADEYIMDIEGVTEAEYKTSAYIEGGITAKIVVHVDAPDDVAEGGIDTKMDFEQRVRESVYDAIDSAFKEKQGIDDGITGNSSPVMFHVPVKINNETVTVEQ